MKGCAPGLALIERLKATRKWAIGLLLRGHPILLISRVITDRIGLHSVLLPLLKKAAYTRNNSSVSSFSF